MRPDASEYLRQIEVAIQKSDQEQLFTAVAGLVENRPADAALLIWAKFYDADDTYFRRILAYAAAKTADSQSRYLWGTLSNFVVSPPSDDATLVNVLSTLQIYDEHDDILSAILAPEFGAFSTHCLASSVLVIDSFCDLLPHLSDRGLLVKLLSRSQVSIIRRQLQSVAQRHASIEKDEALSTLRETAFVELLPDATPRIDQEEKMLLGEPPPELETSTVSLLRSVLANARSSYELRKQAQDVEGVVQEIKLTGPEPIRNRLRVDVFEKLVHQWKTAIRDVAALTRGSSMTTYMLAPAQGSFILRFLIRSARKDVAGRRRSRPLPGDSVALSQSLDKAAELAENPRELSAQTEMSPEARSNILQFVETLAENDLDATVGVLDPRLFKRPRTRIISREILPAVMELRAETEASFRKRHFTGTLEGASQRQGNFEAFARELGHVKGEVPSERRSILLNMVIGRPYSFSVEERVTTTGTGESRPVLTLESVSAAEEEDYSLHAETLEKTEEEFSTSQIPQQDRLDRIVQVVRLLASGREPRPKSLEMKDTASSIRHIGYMRQAAKILGLLDDHGILTRAGQTLALLPESRTLDFLSVQFEVSTVGRKWKVWTNVDDLHNLDENTAVMFLLESGLSRSMAERRARTLRTWLIAFKSLRSKMEGSSGKK